MSLSFLIWTTLSVHFINVASILFKIRIIKLSHNLSYLCKQFSPIPCIHNPNTLWYAVIFFKKLRFCIWREILFPMTIFVIISAHFLVWIHHFWTECRLFIWKIRYWTHQSWKIYLNGKPTTPMVNILIFCVTWYLVIQKESHYYLENIK